MAIKKFLSESGFKHFVEKVIGKTDISSIGDGTIKDAVSSLNLNSTTKLDNSYLYNTDIKKGIIFDKNADGSFFSARPLLSSNIFQITKNDTTSLVTIDSSGKVDVPELNTKIGTNTRLVNPLNNQVARPVYNRLSYDGEHIIEILWHVEENQIAFIVDNQIVASFKRGTVL